MRRMNKDPINDIYEDFTNAIFRAALELESSKLALDRALTRLINSAQQEKDFLKVNKKPQGESKFQEIPQILNEYGQFYQKDISLRQIVALAKSLNILLPNLVQQKINEVLG